MKKAAVISAMILAAALSFQGTWARESVAGEAASVSEAAYTYDNKVSGLTMVIPRNRVENEKSSPAVYQAFLPDEGISLSILSRAYGQPYSEGKMKEQAREAQKFLQENIKKSGEKPVSMKSVETKAGRALLAETKGQGEDGRFSVIRYLFLCQEGTAMISFTMKEEDVKRNRPLVENMVESLSFYTPMQKVSVKGTAYTYDIPSSMQVDYDSPVAPDHVLVAGNHLLMTGVAALPISENREFSFLPSSLASLSDKEKADIESHFRAKLASESSGKYVKNVTFLFDSFHGLPGLKLDFDDQGDHNTSYIFVKDGKYISFDYIYNVKEKTYADQVIAQSAASISL